jgi:hypothetical protein
MADLANAVLALITTMQNVSGMPIAILERQDTIEQFWARSAAILCTKTGDTWCSSDVYFMSDDTTLTGWSKVIKYKNKDGVQKQVCAILPPITELTPSYLADAFGTSYLGPTNYPAGTITADWTMLYNAAHCLDQNFDAQEEKRAKAFATLGLAMLDGNPVFTAGAQQSSWRQLAKISNDQGAYWAAGTGERILFDLWKNQTATILGQNYGCNASVVANTSIDTENIPRDQALTAGQDCSAGNGSQGTVTDSNLWVWMYGTGGIGAPPITYAPMQVWNGDFTAGFNYIWTTATNLAAAN